MLEKNETRFELALPFINELAAKSAKKRIEKEFGYIIKLRECSK